MRLVQIPSQRLSLLKLSDCRLNQIHAEISGKEIGQVSGEVGVHPHQQDLLYLLLLLRLQLHLLRYDRFSVAKTEVSDAVFQVLLPHPLNLLLRMDVLVPAEVVKCIVPLGLLLDRREQVLLDQKLQSQNCAHKRLHDLLSVPFCRSDLHPQVMSIFLRLLGHAVIVKKCAAHSSSFHRGALLLLD